MATTKHLLVAMTACWLGGVSTVAAAQPATKKPGDPGDGPPPRGQGYYPIPPYPEWARYQHVQGDGRARTTFDANGKVVESVMVKSTGSGHLDDNVTSYIKAHWQAPPGQAHTKETVVHYVLRGHSSHVYYTPDPPHTLEGSPQVIIVRITFARSGAVEKTEVIKTSGNAQLDESTTAFIQSHWRSDSGAHEVKTAKIPLGDGRPAR